MYLNQQEFKRAVAACRWRSEKPSNGKFESEKRFMEVKQFKLDTTEGLVKFNIWDCAGQPMFGGL